MRNSLTMLFIDINATGKSFQRQLFPQTSVSDPALYPVTDPPPRRIFLSILFPRTQGQWALDRQALAGFPDILFPHDFPLFINMITEDLKLPFPHAFTLSGRLLCIMQRALSKSVCFSLAFPKGSHHRT